MDHDIGKIVLIEWEGEFKQSQRKGEFYCVDLTHHCDTDSAVKWINAFFVGKKTILESFAAAIFDYRNKPSLKDEKRLSKVGFNITYVSESFTEASTTKEKEQTLRKHFLNIYRERTNLSSCRNQMNMY